LKKITLMTMILTVTMYANLALAGALDPDCTAEKAAKGAAAKATVGVGGRCSPAEAAKDSAKRSAGIKDKGPMEKRGHEETGVVKKVVK
jgi:hypothetical protein